MKRTRRITGDLYAMMDAIESEGLIPVPEFEILKVLDAAARHLPGSRSLVLTSLN